MHAAYRSSSDSDEFATLNRKRFTGKFGQRRPTPPELDPIRLFYESLYREKNESLMAGRWCVEHGVLSEAEARQVVRHLRHAKQSQLESPLSLPSQSLSLKRTSSDDFVSDDGSYQHRRHQRTQTKSTITKKKEKLTRTAVSDSDTEMSDDSNSNRRSLSQSQSRTATTAKSTKRAVSTTSKKTSKMALKSVARSRRLRFPQFLTDSDSD